MDRQSMLHSQKIYFCTDEELAKQQTQCLEILYDYNQTRPSEGEKRGEIQKWPPIFGHDFKWLICFDSTQQYRDRL